MLVQKILFLFDRKSSVNWSVNPSENILSSLGRFGFDNFFHGILGTIRSRAKELDLIVQNDVFSTLFRLTQGVTSHMCLKQKWSARIVLLCVVESVWF